MKKSDILIIILVFALAGMILVANHIRSAALSGNAMAADVYIDGELSKSIYITKEEKTIQVDTDYGKNTIKVHDDGVEVIDADCPDKLCTGFGFRNKRGEQIVCLPHHLYIEVR